jgi:transcriptional regulator with XRE-family HTH domain
MALISPLKLNIARRLKEDKEFRKRFFRGQTQGEIAMGIRSLREKRKMRQIGLAKKCRMKQSAISRIEQSEYSGWSFSTLLRVADALDARLQVTFEPAEIVIDRYEQNENLTQTELAEHYNFNLASAINKEIDQKQLVSPIQIEKESDMQQVWTIATA